jgi:hypothetical protein
MRLLKPLAAGMLALGLLAGGAYAVAQSAAESAVAEAIARLRAALGPDAVVEHGAVRVEPIAGRVRLASLSIMPEGPAGERFVVGDVVADNLRPGGTGFGRLSLHGTRILVGGEERGRIGSVTLEGLTLPAEARFSLADIALDLLDVLDVAWDLPDGSALHLSYLGAGGIGGDRSDRLRIADLVMIGGRDIGFERIELGHLEIDGARLLPAVLAAIEGRAPPAPRGASQATIRDLLVRVDGLDVVRLGEATSNADDAEGRPGSQRSTLAIRDLVIGLPPEARDALDGLEALRLEIGGQAVMDQDRGDYEIESFRLEAEGLGAIELAGRVTGAPLPPIGDPLANGLLHGFTLAFEDAGLTARALAGAARLAGVTEAELRAQLRQTLGELEAMLAALPPPPPGPEPKGGAEPPLPNSKLGPQAGATPQGGRPLPAFLDRPGRITITAQPAQPVPLSQLDGANPGAGPQEWIARLGLRVRLQ